MSGASSQPPCISGFVFDPAQNPVADADLDFDDAVTGERIFTPQDNTDEFGFYRVCLNIPGLYHISFAPPPQTNLLGRQFFNVNLPQGETELNVTLDYGVVVSGTVTSQSGAPIADVDLDADDFVTGERIYTPNDDSDTTGAYWIVIPASAYRLRFQPPAGTRWIGLQLDSVYVPSDTTIDAILTEGNLLSGTVSDNTGRGLADISIDLRDAVTGEKIYMANNKTDTSGAYGVAVASGLYNLRFEPPFGSRFVGVEVDSVTIENDVVRDQILESGWLFSVFVHDSLGAPIQGADLDFIQESTGIKLFTPHDETDVDGFTTFAVLPDTYTVRVQPPPGSIYERAVLNGVYVASDTTFNFTLHESDRYSLSGRVTDVSGNGLSDIDVYFFSSLTGDKIPVSDNQTDSTGYFDLAVPAGIFDIEFSPPRGSRYVGLRMFDVTIEGDTTWNDITLDPGLIFTASVFDGNGLPVENVDLDFVSDSSGVELFTPHDDTDADGMALITVLPGTYTVELTPPGPPPSY
jgi:protocatechuate 3,4-dioxygenase beta subunit